MNTPGGFDRERLAWMNETMAGHVRDGAVPGLVTLLARRGEVRAEAIGTTALGGTAPMRRDSIFRISSMTKPVTAAAVLILVEECRLRLDEPVDRLLPELADRRVLRSPDAELDDTEPARRPILVRDLLDFRLGLGMILTAEAFGYPVIRAGQELGIPGFGPPAPELPVTSDAFMSRLGTLPLLAHPGERWTYNIGSCLQGVLIERAAGQPLDAFLRERIFDPLGMADTGFSVPPAKVDRFTHGYTAEGTTGLEPADAPDGSWSRPPSFPDGAAGLVSTADDYLAFARMLMDGGTAGGERVLSRPSVELMTSGRLTAAQADEAFGGGLNWGYGVQVVTGRDHIWSTPGRYGWDGGLGTSWANDPAEDLVAILLTQRMQFPTANPVYLDFWTSVYQAIGD